MDDLTDPHCEACDRSVCARFPDDPIPALCESCEADFNRELRAGHVMYGDMVVLPVFDEVHRDEIW